MRALSVLCLAITCFSYAEEPVARNATKFTAKNGEQLVADVIVDTNDAPDLAERIDPDNGTYRQAYTTAAAFLVWLEEKRDKDIVRKLNAASRAGAYNAELFTQYCGAAVDSLWKEFAEEVGAARQP